MKVTRLPSKSLVPVTRVEFTDKEVVEAMKDLAIKRGKAIPSGQIELVLPPDIMCRHDESDPNTVTIIP